MITRDQYDALRWCVDMAAQDHRVPETAERLAFARQALREIPGLRVPPGVYPVPVGLAGGDTT